MRVAGFAPPSRIFFCVVACSFVNTLFIMERQFSALLPRHFRETNLRPESLIKEGGDIGFAGFLEEGFALLASR